MYVQYNTLTQSTETSTIQLHEYPGRCIHKQAYTGIHAPLVYDGLTEGSHRTVRRSSEEVGDDAEVLRQLRQCQRGCRGCAAAMNIGELANYAST